MDKFEKLKEPFPESSVSWRVGSTNSDKSKGIALAYIDARDVMKRLDEVFGPTNWQDAYTETQKGRLLCTLSLRIESGEWVSKSDGAGDTDVEGEKGAISDAFKRAAVKWGIGRYLYDLGNEWVTIEPRGKSYAIKTPPKLPAWALPKNAPVSIKPAKTDIKPSSGVAESLPLDQRHAMEKLADEVMAFCREGDFTGAVNHINAYDLSVEEKTFMWGLLPSDFRNKLKQTVKGAK